jgi:CRP-like cAMP-binding protein
MEAAYLSEVELQNIARGAWFSGLSLPLREAILNSCTVLRISDGESLVMRGAPAEACYAVALGSIRISSVTMDGKQVSLAYVEPGAWFGDTALFDGYPHTHDADAHGGTTLLSLRKGLFHALLRQHRELLDALLRLNCQRLRMMFNVLEDINTLPMPARLAKHILMLADRYGTAQGGEIRIGLQLAQGDLGQLVGASRQRINHELKELERQGIVRIERAWLTVLRRDDLAHAFKGRYALMPARTADAADSVALM